MYGTEFKPGKPGRPGPVTLYEKRRQAGTPATLESTIANLLSQSDGTKLSLQEQENRAQWYGRWFGLSPSYAKAVTANLG